MRLVWYVALGGALGSAARYVVGSIVQGRAATLFPIGTLVVNVTGSLLLGFLVRYSLEGSAMSPEVRALLTAGLCGGYTTFSTFSYETAVLIEDGEWRRAALYIGASVVISLAGMFLGLAAARELLAARRPI